MPIEIKELRIKAVVADASPGQTSSMDRPSIEKLKREIIKECMKEVKGLINEQKER